MNNSLSMFGILNRIRAYLQAYLPRAERILHYNSLIRPPILYCSVTWTSCCSHDNISKVFKLQKRCARITLDAQRRHNTEHLFNTLKCVPYNMESDIKRCLMAYKRIIGICPAYINELLQLNNSQQSRNARGANFTILPRKYTREKERGRAFSVTTSRCWKYFAIKLRTSQSVNILKNALYKNFKLSQLRDKSFTPILDNLFLDCMI